MEKSGKKGSMAPVVSRPSQVEEYVPKILHFTFQRPYSDPVPFFSDEPVTLGDFAASGDLDRVRELLEKGVDPNGVDENRITALHMAADRGNLEIVQLLLNSGANVNAQDINEDTPLHNAALCGHREVVSLLLDKGANRDLKNSSGELAGDHLDFSTL